MSELKLVIRAVRLTVKADNLLEELSKVCNDNNLKVNGEKNINPSLLLCYFYEKCAIPQVGISDEIYKLFKALDVKTQQGEPVDIDRIRSMMRTMKW